jgi:hypothetical protein
MITSLAIAHLELKWQCERDRSLRCKLSGGKCLLDHQKALRC